MKTTHEQHDQDPIAQDQDRYVHPDETRSDEQIAHDDEVENRLHMSGANDSDDYWAEYDEYHRELEAEPKAEEKYDFTEKDLEDREKALSWLSAAAADYEKRAEKFGRTKSNPYERDAEPNNKGVSAYSGDEESKALNRVLENGFYATSDDNVYTALRTLATGNLRRAEYFSTWPDGSYKAGEKIEDTELDLAGLRGFTSQFTALQDERDKAASEQGDDPLQGQMKELFGL